MSETNLNPDLHIICGKCGNKNFLSFQINEGDECTPKWISVTCGNCHTLSDLSNSILEVSYHFDEFNHYINNTIGFSAYVSDYYLSRLKRAIIVKIVKRIFRFF